MRTITNDYHDAQILNLGAGSERGPYLVTQTGVAPRAPLPKTRMFVLRPDGFWSISTPTLRRANLKPWMRLSSHPRLK